MMKHWSIKKSPPPDDILWATYGQIKPQATFNDIIMNVILLFLTVILCSPNNNAQAMMSGLEEIGIDKKL